MIQTSLLNDLAVGLPSGVRLQRMVASLRAGFGCDAVALLALEPGAVDCLRPLAAVGLTRDALGRRFPLAEQPRLAALMASREVVTFDADSRLPDPYDGLIEGLKGQALAVHDCMGIRLQQEGRPWGVLTLDGLTRGRLTRHDRSRLAELVPLLEASIRLTRLEREVQDLRHSHARVMRSREDQIVLPDPGHDDIEIVAHSDAMRRLLDESKVVAQSELTVLLLGETGVGKELLARRLHRLSPRHGQPLVMVNCAALPESLAESELFGHAKGAFSGATTERTGRIEAAQGGTLFLDEVGELPLSLQAKLLRTLQNREIQRLGSDKVRKVDVRFVAATNRNLQTAVKEGSFRADLYHRLTVYPLLIPPLRNRHDDILPLAGRFLEVNRARLGLRGLRLSDEAECALLAHDWPGNVRELEHVLGRAALRAAQVAQDGHGIAVIHPESLGLAPTDTTNPGISQVTASTPSAGDPRSPRQASQAAQRQSIELALRQSGGNWSRAARALQMDASNLHKLARRLGMKAGETHGQ